MLLLFFFLFLSEFVLFQDEEKMKTKKLSSPPEPEEVRSVLHYARNIIEEFRRAKHFKHILSTLLEYFPPPIPLARSLLLDSFLPNYVVHFLL